jgi:lipopolysaccharide export system permease protein
LQGQVVRIITKHLGTTIIAYILLVILFLFGLQAFIEFMREFPQMGTGSYGLLRVLEYVPLMLPSDVYQFFPMAGLLGCVLALGLLASHSELIVMRASGLSLVDITLAIAKAAIALILVMLVVGEVLAPIAQKIAIRHKTKAMSDGQTIVTRQGIWMRSDNNFVHIDLVSGDSELQGITRYEFDANRKLKTASYAKSAIYQKGKWMFKDVVQTTIADDKTTSAVFPQQQWELTLSKSLIGMVHVDPDQKSLPQLYSYIKHRKQSGLNAEDYEFIFWQRVFAPLATLIMILLAIPFVFGPLRSVTMGLRMLVGVMVGFSFHILNQFVGPMSVVYQVPPMLAAILPIMIFTLIGGILLSKAR